ncbi:MAG: hypothetical protein NTW94_05905 [Legionellales bacterium]|nr:hypothetical protein [Legionellales bacterium]
MNKILMSLVLGVSSLQIQAFPCYITVVKDSCWTKYDVTVTVSHVGKPVVSVLVPNGQSWARQTFECEPKEAISFTSTFLPVIWQSDAGKVYSAQHAWALPEAIGQGDRAWNIPICYPADFSEVPLPPDAGQNCKCDMKSVPPIQLKA